MISKKTIVERRMMRKRVMKQKKKMYLILLFLCVELLGSTLVVQATTIGTTVTINQGNMDDENGHEQLQTKNQETTTQTVSASIRTRTMARLYSVLSSLSSNNPLVQRLMRAYSFADTI
jgi:formate/nitrite transporter FocA (FNT family)